MPPNLWCLQLSFPRINSISVEVITPHAAYWLSPLLLLHISEGPKVALSVEFSSVYLHVSFVNLLQWGNVEVCSCIGYTLGVNGDGEKDGALKDAGSDY